SLAAPRRPDHQDVLGQYLLAQLGRQLLAAPAIAQRDRDGALGVVLADDVAIKLGDDLARAERRHGSKLSLRAEPSNLAPSETPPHEIATSRCALLAMTALIGSRGLNEVMRRSEG